MSVFTGHLFFYEAVLVIIDSNNLQSLVVRLTDWLSGWLAECLRL